MSHPIHPHPVRIGTRGSKLALIQAELARAALVRADPALTIEIVPITTSGDLSQGGNTLLANLGGKGLFTKEIEEALLDRRVDVAVHSLKDVPTFLPPGLGINAVLPRADVRDAFVSIVCKRLADLPEGARIGTASMRRAAQLQAIRPDFRISPMRGNVDTRLRKLDQGEADATLLALAGLERLGLVDRATEILPVETFLPAAAQGIIGLETRTDDTGLNALLAKAGCGRTLIQANAERALLAALDGSCRTPIGAYAQFLPDGKNIRIDGFVAAIDGTRPQSASRTGPIAAADSLGAALGAELRAAMPTGFWTAES